MKARGERRGRAAVASLLALGLALAGCTQPIARPAGRVAPLADPNQLEGIVDLLIAGDVRTARRALRQIARRSPGDPGVATLLAGIERDPVVELGTRNHDYVVKPGDSWLGLAQRQLGDRLKFYALARYNGLTTAGALAPGQGITLPGDPPPPPPPPPPPAPSPAPKPRPEPEKPKVEKPAAAPVTAPQLHRQGAAALRRGQTARAIALLSEAQRLDPADAAIRSDLARARRIAAAVRARRAR